MQQPLNDYLYKVINSKFNDTQQESMFADEQPSRETLLRESGMKASRSAIKSVEANIKRGKRAMNTAITERRTVHRAMFNHELGGWVDFEWGDDGLTKPFNKKGEPVGKGIAHIIEARQRKDGMSYQDVVRMLTNNVVETIAKGEVAGHWVRNEGKSESIQLDYNGYRAGLIKNKGSNAWLLTAFELYPTDANSAGSVDTERATQSKPTLTRQGMGAVGGQNVRSNDQDVNSSPDIEQARTIIERNLGKEFAERIEFMRSSDFPSDDGRAKSEGFFIDGKIHLVVDNIDATDVMNRAERMVWVAWHEFAHNGVDVKYGNQYDRVMAHARSNPLIKRLSQIKQAEYRNEGLEINENVATEESLAEIYAAIKTGNWTEIESRYSLKVGDVWKKGSSKGKLETLLEQVARVFRNIASKITGKDLRKASTGDVLAILRKVDNAVNDVVSWETQTENNGESRYSLNESPDSEFAKAVDDLFNSYNKHIIEEWIELGTTPEALIKAGIDDLPMFMNKQKIGKIKNEHPEMTADLLKQIPKQLNNPVAIFKNTKGKPNSYVILTELRVKDGELVIAALHANETVNGLEFHKLASSYGKDGTANYLTNMVDKSDVRFVDKQKVRELQDTLHLLAPETLNALFNKASVVKGDNDVNNQAENSTRYSIRPNKKQSALEMMTSEKVNQNPDLLDRLSEGGYKQLKSNLKKEFDKGVAYIDEKVHDRLRPVVDWIKGFDIQGLSDLDKKRIVDTIYAAEGVKASD